MYNALGSVPILLPRSGVDLTRWSVIACDQFTSQPKYWENAKQIVGSAPSTLNLVLPEAWLEEAEERIPAIRASMASYIKHDILYEAVQGAVLVERETISGKRIGLVAALDLDAYDYSEASASLIRPTEQTVPERVPPRTKIRMDAPLELPHVMMLIDDPQASVIEPMYEVRDSLRSLYDFDLMLEGGHLRGWAVEGNSFQKVDSALQELANTCDGLLYAVGDGNHSLAAAKQCWNAIRAGLSDEERASHPARWALVELINIHCTALQFEPIHRLLLHADMTDLLGDLERNAQTCGMNLCAGNDVVLLQGDKNIGYHFDNYPLPFLQSFLDAWLQSHPEARIDYIHGEETVRELAKERNDSIGILVRGFQKQELFPTIRMHGKLPRKAFSMGVSTEKRYYMEAHAITE